MKSIIRHLTAPWRTPTIQEMAERELEITKRQLFKSETLLIYHENQIRHARSVIPVLERKIQEAKREQADA